MARPHEKNGQDFGRILDARRHPHAPGRESAPGFNGRSAAGMRVGHVLAGIQESAELPTDQPFVEFARHYEQCGQQAEAPVDAIALGSMLEAVAAELNVLTGSSPNALKRFRRDFALANHPDRVCPALREHATRRMAAANSLIDQALKRKSNQTA